MSVIFVFIASNSHNLTLDIHIDDTPSYASTFLWVSAQLMTPIQEEDLDTSRSIWRERRRGHNPKWNIIRILTIAQRASLQQPNVLSPTVLNINSCIFIYIPSVQKEIPFPNKLIIFIWPIYHHALSKCGLKGLCMFFLNNPSLLAHLGVHQRLYPLK